MTGVVVDTSALAAVVFGEPDASVYLAVMLDRAGELHVSAATVVETSIVVEAKQGHEAYGDLRVLLDTLNVSVEPLDNGQAQSAVAAWRRFGKGRHPAALNLGDCFTYALAKQLGASLLFKGKDFAQTDVTSAL
jgi:ribonuclease VapC